MEPMKFDVVRFIALGAYSVVYEIAYPEGNDKVSTTKWALKRFYLRNKSAVWCALREHSILVRLARAEQQSPFVCTLLQSLRLRGGPALVLRKGSGFDLCDLTLSVGFLREEYVRFYSSEIICGLEYLHAMNIVHLDVKPTNILLDDWGHVFITDFDRAYDMTREAEPPKETDFAGTPFFRAPEVRDKIAITTKADVWSLGILVAAMIYTRSAINRWIRIGPVRKDDLPNASVPLQQFLRACLSRNHVKRVAISDVKRLQFFEDVNWEQVVACKIQPPYHPSQLKVSVTKDVYKIDPYDHLLLAAAYRKCKPLIDKRLHDYRDRHGVRRLMELPTSRKRMLAAGLTAKKMDELFADFEFTNPHFLQSSRGVDGDQAVSGHRHGSSDCKEDKLRDFS